MELREKVSLAVAHCLRSNDCSICEACPYNEGTDYGCRARLRDDIIELLKAQEPMVVEERADTDTINCPKCGQQFARVGRDKSIYLDTDEEPNYCPKCGQAVKWE